jgi:DNA-binding NarL/FixJ family response regulator
MWSTAIRTGRRGRLSSVAAGRREYHGPAVTTEKRPGGAPRGKRSAAPKRNGRIHLLLVDEHPVLRAGVRSLLENDDEVSVVAEAQTLDEAVDACREAAPDVVLLDVDMADVRRVDEMQRLRREVPSGALVVLGRHDDDEGLFRAVVGGAVGHVGENEGPEQLVETIKEAAHGEEPIQRTLAQRPSVGRRVLETFAELAQRGPMPGHTELSDREMRILELAAEGKTNSQIGREIGLSEHTVKGAISQLLARFRLRHRTEAVVHALRLGWIAAPRRHEPEPAEEDGELG